MKSFVTFSALMAVGLCMPQGHPNLSEVIAEVVPQATQVLEHLSTICGGAEPRECECFYGNTETIVPPFIIATIMDCSPNMCTCEDDSQVQPDSPVPVFSKPFFETYKESVFAVCEGEIESCTCSVGDTTEISGAVEPTDVELYNCMPSECLCLYNGTTEAIEAATPPQPIIDQQGEAEKLCDDGFPTECPCTHSEATGAFYPASKNFIHQMFCQPRFCTCSNGDTVKHPRPEPKGNHEATPAFKTEVEDTLLNELSTICGGEMPSECECFYGNTKTIVPPFTDVARIMDCSPNMCTCLDGSQVQPDSPIPVFAKKFYDLYRENTHLTCEGEIESCACSIGEVTELSASVMNTDVEISNCMPTECTCKDGTTEAIEEVAPPQPIIDQQAEAEKLCEDGFPTECPCTHSEATGVFYPASKNFLHQMFCQPRFCYCSNGDTVKHPRPQPKGKPVQSEQEEDMSSNSSEEN
jgi:hypothetical protein